MTEVAAPLAAPTFSDHIVFVDESGDHSLVSINPDYPVFVLAFCILPCAAYIEQITPAVRKLKFDLFGHDLVILHEHDIRKKSGPFAQLGKVPRDALMEGLTSVIAAAPMTLDVDGNGKYEALADGLLLIRYLFGLTGDALTSGIVTDSSAFLERVSDLRPVLDVDGNGQADALTDGILILRYLFGLRGNQLITNAIGAAATRTTPDAVIGYLQTLFP